MSTCSKRHRFETTYNLQYKTVEWQFDFCFRKEKLGFGFREDLSRRIDLDSIWQCREESSENLKIIS
jgi:hypothetical protein